MTKRFIAKFLLFSPFWLIGLSLFAVTYHIGQAFPINFVIEWQNTSSTPIFYVPVWYQDNLLPLLQYKIMAEMYRHADILVFGS
ncbi:MAG: hypothetical protein D6712_07720, partial [Chloroflexi bacterium]